MSKPKIFFLILVALFAGAAYAESPATGHIAGKAYVNSYFHLTYAWPAMLTPVKLPSADAERNNPKAYEFVLFSAQQGKQPYGLVMVAQKLNVAGPHSSGVKSSADMIDRLTHSLRPGPILSNFARSQKKNARGMLFDELSYQMNGKPSSVMATQVGQYLIVFKCNAQSAADMALMEKSALAMRVAK